jgi:hypothetical protein
MDAIRSSETSVLKGATWRNIPEDGILHMQLCLKGHLRLQRRTQNPVPCWAHSYFNTLATSLLLLISLVIIVICLVDCSGWSRKRRDPRILTARNMVLCCFLGTHNSEHSQATILGGRICHLGDAPYPWLVASAIWVTRRILGWSHLPFGWRAAWGVQSLYTRDCPRFRCAISNTYTDPR